MESVINKPYSWDKKVQTVSSWMMLGDMSLVAALVKIPHQTIRLWKTQDWWKEVEGTIRESENIQTNSKLKKIVEKSLDTVMDRLEEGDFQYDPRTGKFVRKPVLLRDAAKAAEVMMHRKALMSQIAEQKLAQPSVEEALKRIAAEFVKLAKGDNEQSSPEAIAKELQERVRELPGKAGADQGQISQEPSAPQDGTETGTEDFDGRGSQEGDVAGGSGDEPFEPAASDLDSEPLFSPYQEGKA